MNTVLPHQRGGALEELLQWQHSVYSANGRARIWHNGTKAEMHRGETVMVKSRPDFEGVLTCLAGKHVAFDAKTTASMLYRHHRKRLHQLQDLWGVHEAGGVAFLFITLNFDRFFMVWPQPAWAYRQLFSIRLDQLDQRGVEVQCAGGYDLPDWLSVIERVFAT